VLLLAARESSGGDVSREYFGVDSRLAAGRWWSYGRAELDWNRGWRRDAADGRSIQLSDLSLSLAHRPRGSRSLALHYDLRRNYRTAETRDLPVDALDDFLRQGLRLNLDWGGRGLGLSLGGGVRFRQDAERNTYSLSAGVRHSSLRGYSSGLDASAFTNLYTEGVVLGARGSRSFRGGHQASFGYGASLSRVHADGSRRFDQWLRGSGYARLGRGAFFLLDLDYGFGDDLRGPRASLELGYRR
jgi:hypothetical protein